MPGQVQPSPVQTSSPQLSASTRLPAAPSGSQAIAIAPPSTAVKKAAIGRAIAITGPMSPQVKRIESTDDSGVVVRNDRLAGWLAPLRRISTEIGTTPQLHTGSGTPTSAAMVTPPMPGRPSQRWIARAGRSTWTKPATARPKSRKGAARRSVRRVSAAMDSTRLTSPR